MRCARGRADGRDASEGQSFPRREELLGAVLDLPAPDPERVPSQTLRASAGRPRLDPRDLHMHTSWSFDCTIARRARDHARPRGSADRGHRTTTSSAARSRRRPRTRPCPRRNPRQEVKTDGQGEVIGLFLGAGDPERGCRLPTRSRRFSRARRSRLPPHPFDRMHSIPEAGDAPPPPGRHRCCSRSTTARLLFDPRTTRPCGSRASTTWTAGAGSDRRPSGRRHRRLACERSATGGVPESRSGAAEVVRRPKSLAYLQT